MSEVIDLSLESVSVKVGSRTLTFYPLNFKALRTMGAELEALRNAETIPAARIDAICKTLTASANRDGQQVTQDDIEELFDPKRATKVLEAVHKISGMSSEVTEKSAEGAARPMNGLGGAESTPQ